jgi:hypothetical protein
MAQDAADHSECDNAERLVSAHKDQQAFNHLMIIDDPVASFEEIVLEL